MTMRFRFTFAVAVLATVISLSDAYAAARFFGTRCTPYKNQRIDPIVSPGVEPSAHLHTFFGNRAVSKDSTAAQLQSATATSCANREFNAAMWIPAMRVNGVVKQTRFVVDYWWTDGRQMVVPWPFGLGLVAGSPTATAKNPEPLNVLWYDCGGDSRLSHVPYSCSGGSGITAHVVFPNCWTGDGNSAADVAYPEPFPVPFAGQEPPQGPCPMDYPVVMPMVHVNVRTGLSRAAGLSWSSGSVYSLHADYWQTFHDQAYLAGLVASCLNRNVGCGIDP